MSKAQPPDSSMQRRVSDYLRESRPRNNVFVAASEAAEAEMDEYLLRRAEQELQQAQAKFDALKRKLQERRQLAR